ncbi:protoporphyrinogen oxidase HemJ [Jhaorihella thermophila]|uniref:Protoporphyrinogen IX oxidase n=1 Tax=Jhaorihella thermophila TaxID=488547 RepID=A0A1H5VS42_9RHOB|nr:protoporphyrinogen oxidase HemJ [Jhaorihella thermophila]SEF89337.1 putative membrane protein [Jhaorihella thermophila]
MSDALITLYPWIKAFHIMAVMSWMAGLFYLPRLYVYHVERAGEVKGAGAIFDTMEYKLLRFIMRPAMFASWILGLLLVATPGIVDWSWIWPWTKGAAVLAMTGFHMWLAARRRDFEQGRNRLTGRQYRIMNEVPTVLMAVIVISVVVKF